MHGSKFRLVVLSGAVVSLLASQPVINQENDKPEKNTERITAVAQGTSGAIAGSAANVTIRVNEYSSDQEVMELAEALRANGQDELEKQLDKIKEKGNISVATSLGYGVPVIRERQTEGGGRRVALLTNRPISFYEARNSPRSRDYRFGVVILQLDAKGEGSGVLYGATQIKFDKNNQLEVEHYGMTPIRLVNVRASQ